MTTVIFSNEVCSTFTMMSSRTLLSDHILKQLLSHSVTISDIYDFFLSLLLHCTITALLVSSFSCIHSKWPIDSTGLKTVPILNYSHGFIHIIFLEKS
jgi:hypothetical protein